MQCVTPNIKRDFGTLIKLQIQMMFFALDPLSVLPWYVFDYCQTTFNSMETDNLKIASVVILRTR